MTHDNCYDDCAAKGQKALCNDLSAWLGIVSAPLCHCICDAGCVANYNFNCGNWMNGLGPYEYFQQYSDMPVRSGPLKTCPAGAELFTY